MFSEPRAPRRHAVVVCLSVGLVALLCGAMIAAAALVPAPPAVLPLIVLVGIGCPMGAACELPRAIAALRDSGRGHRRAVERLRRHLDALPETQHPLGL